MLNIQPISELRNYTKVLKDVKKGAPVILTKNGKSRYVISAIEDLDADVINEEIDTQMYERLAGKWRQAQGEAARLTEDEFWGEIDEQRGKRNL